MKSVLVFMYIYGTKVLTGNLSYRTSDDEMVLLHKVSEPVFFCMQTSSVIMPVYRGKGLARIGLRGVSG